MPYFLSGKNQLLCSNPILCLPCLLWEKSFHTIFLEPTTHPLQSILAKLSNPPQSAFPWQVSKSFVPYFLSGKNQLLCSNPILCFPCFLWENSFQPKFCHSARRRSRNKTRAIANWRSNLPPWRAKPETSNLKQKNFLLFPSHNQRVKKKIQKEFKKDLESPKRVLLLHPHWKRRSRENWS